MIADCEFRDWEPARRVGVRRTIADFKSEIPNLRSGLVYNIYNIYYTRSVILFELAALPSTLKLRRDKPLSPAPNRKRYLRQAASQFRSPSQAER